MIRAVFLFGIISDLLVPSPHSFPLLPCLSFNVNRVHREPQRKGGPQSELISTFPYSRCGSLYFSLRLSVANFPN